MWPDFFTEMGLPTITPNFEGGFNGLETSSLKILGWF
jgi:hypothetical protein